MDHRAAKPIHREDREARLFQEVARTGLRFEGAPIRVTYMARLTAHRGKLLSGSAAGQPVFAGTFLRKREIVLDSALRRDKRERARILIHELFHFVWMRLGNPDRESWSELLRVERDAGAKGELGWSSEWRKEAAVRWRDYICESFCDSAAWLYAGLDGHEEFTLAKCWQTKRRAWFEDKIAKRSLVRI